MPCNWRCNWNLTGSGANLTSIPAGQLTGTIADARVSASSVHNTKYTI